MTRTQEHISSSQRKPSIPVLSVDHIPRLRFNFVLFLSHYPLILGLAESNLQIR